MTWQMREVCSWRVVNKAVPSSSLVSVKKKTRAHNSKLQPKSISEPKKSLGLLFGLVALIPATRLSLVTFYDNITTLRKYIGNVW